METIGKILQMEHPQRISTTPTTLPRFDEVQLSDEEKGEILHQARLAKYWRQTEIWNREDALKAREEAMRKWSAKEMYDYAQVAAGKNYRMDEFNTPLFELLALYFSEDKKFEEKGYSLKKGILLAGPVGVGKTELLKAFRRNKRQCFVVESCTEAERHCREKGVDFWKNYTGYVPGHGGTDTYFYQPDVGWMFDDLGTEEIINDYGNKLDALEKIIQHRYALKDIIPFSSLHLTTNMDAQAIENRYGQRVRSRMREMFNFLELKGADRRK